MINLFQISPQDQSIYYLGQIFGYMGNLFPVSNASIILGTMFKTFNSIVLTVAVGIVLYVTVAGVMKTAAEGEMLGRQWKSIWLPIRMVLGIAALVPTPTGYSTMQIVMMWVIVQGIGAADTLWTTVLQYSQLMGSPTAAVGVPSVDVSNNMETLFQSLVCQSSAKANYSNVAPIPSQIDIGGNGSYWCANNSDNFCKTDYNELEITGLQSISIGTVVQILNPMTILNPNQSNQPATTRQNYSYSIGPSASCGTMTFCDPDSTCKDTSTMEKNILCESCKAQKQTLQETVNALGAIAKIFVDADYSYRSFYTTGGIPPSGISNYCNAIGLSPDKCCVSHDFVVPGVLTPKIQTCGINGARLSLGDSNNADDNTIKVLYWPYLVQPNLGQQANFIQVVSDNYITAITSAVVNAMTQQISQTNITDSTLQSAQQQGWIMAGAFYYYLAQANNKNAEAASPTFTVVGSDPSVDPGNSLFNYRNNYNGAGSLLDTIDDQFGGGMGNFSMSLSPKLKKLNKIGKGLKALSGNIMKGFEKMVTGSKGKNGQINPLSSLQMLGKILLIVAQAFFGLVIAVIIAITVAGYFNVFVLGTGFQNFVGPVVSTLTVLFTPFFLFLIGGLFTFGALLAVYTPLIPYMIYTMGAVAWFILVIEAMIAGPLVALAILSPSGQHEILGKADHALMYLFGIFLRPTLMVFGMIASMLLSIVVVTMINAGFIGVMGSIMSHPGLVEIFLFLAAYVSLILAALNKCFALIHIIPDRTLRWIGGQPGQEGQEAAAEVLGKVETGIGKMAGGFQDSGAGFVKGARGSMDLGGKLRKAREDRIAARKNKSEEAPEIKPRTPKGKSP